MSEREWFDWVVMAIFGAAVVTAVAVVFISAPYGRHTREGWGPSLPGRLAWILMETPPVVFFAWVFWQGAARGEWIPLIFLALWQVHYVHRAFIFPFRLRIGGKRTPWVIVVLALVFNVPNAYVNARWISHFGVYESAWLWSPAFGLGVLLFGAGLLINLHSDSILMNLRGPGETGYKIPRGGLFRWVTAPNYLGELLEWLGWAVATWSLSGLAFFVYAVANLAPRAWTHHRWYREQFPEYPKERRALVPFLF